MIQVLPAPIHINAAPPPKWAQSLFLKAALMVRLTQGDTKQYCRGVRSSATCNIEQHSLAACR